LFYSPQQPKESTLFEMARLIVRLNHIVRFIQLRQSFRHIGTGLFLTPIILRADRRESFTDVFRLALLGPNLVSITEHVNPLHKMPKYWMINDRSQGGVGPDVNADGVTYWVSDKQPLTDINNWRKVTAANFQKLLVAAADNFPAHDPAENEKQSHVTILVHGFNNKFTSATKFYQDLCGRLFGGPDSLGLCILYDWPSRGSLLGYEPDRSHARLCAHDLTDVLSALFDWLVARQQETTENPAKACKAKVSLIAHSMGNYVVQKAMAAAWTRKNQPLLVSLINQLLMVAADVDSDLFDMGAPDNNDGNAVANLTYRITALYSGRDSVLGASAGLKHFGMRRLGRSGLSHRPPLADPSSPTDNVWDVDCSSFFNPNVQDIHGAYFLTDGTLNLMRYVLRGLDRGVLETLGYTKGTAWP
jgi:esterase/lipase superfamily enzyme